MTPAVPRSVSRVGEQKGRFKGHICRKRKSSGLLTSLFRSFFFSVRTGSKKLTRYSKSERLNFQSGCRCFNYVVMADRHENKLIFSLIAGFSCWIIQILETASEQEEFYWALGVGGRGRMKKLSYTACSVLFWEEQDNSNQNSLHKGSRKTHWHFVNTHFNARECTECVWNQLTHYFFWPSEYANFWHDFK